MNQSWQDDKDLLLEESINSGRLTGAEIIEISNYLYSARALQNKQNVSKSDLREISFLYGRFERMVRKALPGRLPKSVTETVIGVNIQFFEIRPKIDRLYFCLGLFTLMLAVLPFFTDVLFMPRKYNAQSVWFKSDNPGEFYRHWQLLWFITIFTLMHSKVRFSFLAEPLEKLRSWSNNQDPKNVSVAFIIFSLSPFIAIFLFILVSCTTQ